MAGKKRSISKENARIIADAQGMKDLRRQAAELRRTIRTASAQLEKIEERIEAAEAVTEIRDGMALSIENGPIRFVRCASDATTRGGEFYPNAHRRGHWGVRVYEDYMGRRGDRFRGYSWTSETAAREAVIAWVVHGTVPPYDGVAPDNPATTAA